MKRLLYTTIFVGLVLVLAVAAVFALKGPAPTQTASAAPAAESGQTSSLAPTATDNYNFIALPLDSSDSFSYTASGLASYVPGTKKVVRWDATNQQYVSYTPGISPPSADFSLDIGGVYFLLLDSTADNVVSFVGDVPAQGSVSFTLTAGTASSCVYNAISIPLDQDQIATAQDLADAITGTTKVTKWDATNQQYISYTPGISPPSANFDVAIGYPYFVCLDDTAPSQWP